MTSTVPTLRMSVFTDGLRKFLDSEYEAQKKATHDDWKLPLAARVQKGDALANLTVLKGDDFGLDRLCGWVTVSYGINNSKFKVGSYVLLHRGNPFDSDESYAFEIFRDNGNQLELYGKYTPGVRTIRAGSGWVLDSNSVDLRRFMHDALDQLALAPSTSALAGILLHRHSPTFNEQARTEAKILVQGLGMNEPQQEAFVNAYAATNHYLVQGPPGTGKTWVLAQLAVAFARQGKRVLITSFTNRGINNALRKIKETTGYEQILKVGKPVDADDLGPVVNEEYCPALKSVDGNEFIIGGTPFSLWTSRMKGTHFDVVIFDEASQINQVQAAAAMLVGTKYVFIGDHQQMPPIIAGLHQDAERRQSIFEYLFAFSPGTMLTTTYRMNAAIADFSSRKFYGGALQSHASAATRTLILPVASEKYPDVFQAQEPSIFVDLLHANTKTSEYNEAYYIADMIGELLACGVPAQEIAVVAPYRAQGRLIRQHLNTRCPEADPHELDKITIDTVEKMQGQERDIVFISLTSGLFQDALQRAEFYFMPNRLNVALTRARVKRIVVGSSRLFSTRFDSPELQQWADNFKEFYSSCHLITRFKLIRKPAAPRFSRQLARRK